MAGVSTVNTNLTVEQPNRMSIGDMLNIARGAQAYKQAEQVNPLLVQQQQAETELAQKTLQPKIEQQGYVTQQAQQKTNLGDIDVQVAQQKNNERLALQEFFKDPENFQTNGQIDINKVNKAVPALAPLTGTEVIKNIADVSHNQTTAKEASQKFKQGTRALVAQTLSVAGRSGNQDPKYYIKELDNLLTSDPTNKELIDYVNAQKNLIDKAPKNTDLANGAIQHAQDLLTASEQETALARKAGTADLGGAVYSTEIQPSIGTNKPTITLGPKLGTKTLAPQVVTSETGAPVILAGGGGNNVGAGRAGTNVAGTGVGGNAMPGKSTIDMTAPPVSKAIKIVPGEPYDAFRTRAAEVGKMIPAAAQALSPNNPDSIQGAQYTNDKVLHLLDNPKLEIGPIAKAIAEKTGNIGLSNEQQEIQKYLEQRMRMEAARTNQDQNSQRVAFGSFGTDKEALREIIYKDKGTLAGQELYNKGILNNAGDINSPNFQAVNKFNAEYSKLNDPKVAHLIGVIGDKSLNDLSQSDKKHISKEFKGMSPNQINALFEKRQKLLNLVEGK